MSNDTVATEATVNAEVTEPVTPEVPAPTKEEFAAQDGVLRVLAASAANAKEHAEKRHALTTGRDEVVRSILDTSDDPVIVKAREENANLKERIAKANEMVKANEEAALAQADSLVPASNKEEAEKHRVAYLEAKREVKAIEDTLAILLGSTEQVARAKEAYGIVSVVSSPSGKTASDGEQIFRKKISSVTIDGEVFADSKGKVSFTTLSSKLGVKGDTLRELAVKAGGKSVIADFAADETVAFTVTDSKKVERNLVVTFA